MRYATVYVQACENPNRKTKWDLIAVKKNDRIINMDSQVTNTVVKEWLERGNFIENITNIRTEVTYKKSRFDLYVEADGRKIFIEVKGVTLEENQVVSFPDAPSERAVKHIAELTEAVKEGYEAFVFFVVQMDGVHYFTPNMDTHPEFGEMLRAARAKGVNVVAFDCKVGTDSICIAEEVPVVLHSPALFELRDTLVDWYQKNHRKLAWRERVSAYHTWVSEIMLQQTRVEAVKPFYERFLKELPTIKALAECEEDKLLKLWEGLGYYNRVRNMQKAAIQIMQEHQGEFPKHYEEIRKLKGIGNYTAGAISSIAFGIPKPAVDGNVLRVISRILCSDEDIMNARVRQRIEEMIEEVIPIGHASEFNQGLIELGAVICVPNGKPKCEECPVIKWCMAKKQGKEQELPVKKKKKTRKKEKKTIFIFRDKDKIAIKKRSVSGLLAGMYEFPSVAGHLNTEEVMQYSKVIGLMPIRVKELSKAKHIFSHIEWDMIGYFVQVDELEQINNNQLLFVEPKEIQNKYPIPAAFEAYMSYVDVKLGQGKYT